VSENSWVFSWDTRINREIECERRESHHTSRAKLSWIYICRATIARKYIVASATMVRTTAENLNVVTLRYAHQTTTRNADTSKRSLVIRNPRQSEQTQPLTKRSGDRIRKYLEPVMHIGRAHVKGLDRELGDVEERYGPEESRQKRQC